MIVWLTLSELMLKRIRSAGHKDLGCLYKRVLPIEIEVQDVRGEEIEASFNRIGRLRLIQCLTIKGSMAISKDGPPMNDSTITATCKARMFSGVRVRTCCMMIVLMLMGTFSFAQQTNRGQVLGNVTDISGGAVPSATVKLINVERGDVTPATTNKRGEYLFPSVAIGSYKLEISKDGYSTVTEDSINVDADQNVRVDSVLSPASATGITVEVQANANTVDTQSATIGVLIDDRMVHNLPVEGGNVVQLAALLPGVSNVSAPTTFTDDTAGPTYNVSGSRSTQNLFLLDGSLWNNLYTNSGLNFPPIEALQEVSVLLNNFKAQYGRNTGSVFNALTKSGSNTLHGSAYDYFQNASLNATDYFLGQIGQFAQGVLSNSPVSSMTLQQLQTTQSELSWLHPTKDVFNEYGGTVGGPIKRDKLFYFAAYQGLRYYTDNDQIGYYGFSNQNRGLASDGDTPLSCSATGSAPSGNHILASAGANYCMDFSDLVGLAYLPPATTGYPDGAVDNPLSSAITAVSQSQTISELNLAYTQAGNKLAPGTNSPCVQILLAALSINSKYTDNSLPTICINPVMGGMGGINGLTGVNGGLIGRYMPLPNLSSGNPYTHIARTAAQAPWPQLSDLGLLRVDYISSRNQIDARYYQADTSSSITANTTGVASYELDNQASIAQYGDIGDKWTVRPTMLNELRLAYKRYFFHYQPADSTQLSDFGANFPNYNTYPSLPALPNMGATNQQLYYTVNEDIEAVDNLSWMHGNHSFMFGVDAFRMQYENINESAPYFNFGTSFTFIQQSDELLGLVYNETFANSLNRAGIQHDYFYAQDDWRAAPRLTLSIGLRYELPLRYFQPDNQNTTFIPYYQSQIFPNAVPDLAFVGDPGIRRALIKNEYEDIAPRFGLAYDVTGKGRTVFRTGFGMFYEATNALTIGVGEPFHYQATYNYPTGGISQPLLGEPAIVPNWNGTNPQFSLPFSIFYPDKNYRGAYTMAYNIGFQQSIAKQGLLEMNYVLRLGRHQSLPLDRNPAIYACSGAYYQINPTLYCPSTGQTTNSSYQSRVVYPGFNYGGQGVVDYMSIGTSNYNGLQIHYKQSATRKLTIQATFAYAKSMDEFSSGTSTKNAVPQVYNLASEYGPSDYDVKLSTGIAWTFAPVKFTHGNRVAQAIFSGWTQGGYYNAQTGQPFSILAGIDGAYTDEPNQRAILNPSYGSNGTLPGNRHRADKINAWFDNSLPSTNGRVGWDCIGSNKCGIANDPHYSNDVNGGFYSNQSRNDVRGPAFIMLNVNVGRTFRINRISKTSQLAIRMEAINALNEPNLATPNHQMPGSSGVNTFGEITQTTGPNNNTRGNNARRIQIFAKYSF